MSRTTRRLRIGLLAAFAFAVLGAVGAAVPQGTTTHSAPQRSVAETYYDMTPVHR